MLINKLKTSKPKNLNFTYYLWLIVFFTLGFFACKRSIHHQTNREYDAKLVQVLRKLEHQYADKKVRINTWDQKLDAYQDLSVLDDESKTADTLTIGDSVEFVGLDLSQPDGIRAKILIQDHKTGYIPYFKVEEFEPAMRIDPDLK